MDDDAKPAAISIPLAIIVMMIVAILVGSFAYFQGVKIGTQAGFAAGIQTVQEHGLFVT